MQLFVSFLTAVFSGVLVILSGCASVSSLSVDEVRQMNNASLCYLNAIAPVGFIPLEFDRRTRDRHSPLVCSNHEEEILAALHKSDSAAVPPGLMNQQDCSGISLGANMSSQTTTGQGILGTWKHTTTGSFRKVRNGRREVIYVLFSVEDKEGRSWERLLKLPPNHEEVVRFNQFMGGQVEVSILGCRAFR